MKHINKSCDTLTKNENSSTQDKIIEPSYYGCFGGKLFYKFTWQKIISLIPESEWHVLKRLNKKFYFLVKQSCVSLTKNSCTQDKISELCSRNMIESVMMLGRKINFNVGFYEACRSGNKNIIDYMIRLGAKDWNIGLQGACHGGNMLVIKLMIIKGADDWNRGLQGACQGGYMNIVEYMIDRGADNWNIGLYGACQGNQHNMIMEMIEKGANRCYCLRSITLHKFLN